MKFLYFFAGFLLFVGGAVISVHGELNGWDATIASGPMVLGVALIIVSIVFAAEEAEDRNKKR